MTAASSVENWYQLRYFRGHMLKNFAQDHHLMKCLVYDFIVYEFKDIIRLYNDELTLDLNFLCNLFKIVIYLFAGKLMP